MSHTPAIQIEALGKRYRYGGAAPLSANLRADITDWFKGLFRRNGRGHPTLQEVHERHIAGSPEYFWALRDIHLSIAQGETVGIIGRNGAGKSTLLKILSRITPPTTGLVRYRGRIASLLEVGTGFHRELTGRENIFLNGSILGMTRREITRKLDAIVAFAEIEKFLDTPVKFYSSGMYVRLAFAVAAHLEPEILLVDEVLAVGDASFQKRCLGKMGEVAKEGRTVLFVSHNMIAVNSLCRRAIWLQDGQVRKDGRPDSVVSDYLQVNSNHACQQRWADIVAAPGNDTVRLRAVSVFAETGGGPGPLTMQTPFIVETEFWNLKPGAKLHITLHFYNDHGLLLFTTWSCVDPAWRLRPLAPGLYRCRCHVPARLLNSGFHSVSVVVVEDGARVIFQRDAAVGFEVQDIQERDGGCMNREPGLLQPILDWDTVCLADQLPASTSDERAIVP